MLWNWSAIWLIVIWLSSSTISRVILHGWEVIFCHFIFFVELNFLKVKWLLFGTYNPPSQNDICYFNQLSKAIDTYNNYDKILLIGDFNNWTLFESFLYEHDLQNLAKGTTCFKSVENPSCIDLILINRNMSFQKYHCIRRHIWLS